MKIYNVLLLAALTGCAQIQAKLDLDVQAATVPDLRAAVADAQAAGDADGVACWTDVLNYVQNLPSTSSSSPAPTIAGVASALEAARIGAQALNTGIVIPPIPKQLHRDCAVLVVDAQQLALKLGISAAALSKGVGAVKVLNSLPAKP